MHLNTDKIHRTARSSTSKHPRPIRPPLQATLTSLEATASLLRSADSSLVLTRTSSAVACAVDVEPPVKAQAAAPSKVVVEVDTVVVVVVVLVVLRGVAVLRRHRLSLRYPDRQPRCPGLL